MAKMTFTYDKRVASEVLGFVILSYREALIASLDDLADVKGCTNLDWLDDIEKRAIEAFKNADALGLSMEDEALAMKFGIDALSMDLAGQRKRLSAR